jgi:asparagine synthase (glutamine-hydrolysing)
MGLELRHPYRDRRLVEFMLAVPAYQLYDGRFFKPIVRNAMEGLLPEPVRMRQAPTSLAPLYRRGLLERETEVVSRIMGKPEAVWRKYVSADWLNQVAPSRLRSGVDGGDTVVLWQCVSMELWRDRQGALST